MNVQTVRYYERRGLLMPARRTAGGYRVYSGDRPRVVGFINRVQPLGFSLDEVTTLMRLRSGAPASRRGVCALAEAKAADIGERIRDLVAMRDHLHSLIADCASDERRGGDPGSCAIIDALDDDAEIPLDRRRTS